MIAAMPIAVSNLEFVNFAKLAQAFLNRNLTSELDSKGVDPRTLGGYVALLGQFQCAENNPIATLRDPGVLGRHAMVTFLVTVDKSLVYEILMHSKICVIDCENEKMYIMSATLEDWRAAIINFTSLSYSSDLSKLSNVIVEQLDKLGLSRLFDNYARKIVHGQLILFKK